MCILRILMFIVLPHCFVHGQIINIVENEWDSDVKVYFTSLEWNADGVVYKTPSRHHALNMPGHWFILRGWDGRCLDCINIYVVERAADAELKIYITKDESKVRLNDHYLNGGMRRKKPRLKKRGL